MLRGFIIFSITQLEIDNMEENFFSSILAREPQMISLAVSARPFSKGGETTREIGSHYHILM
jgi:hypothetical protein